MQFASSSYMYNLPLYYYSPTRESVLTAWIQNWLFLFHSTYITNLTTNMDAHQQVDLVLLDFSNDSVATASSPIIRKLKFITLITELATKWIAKWLTS